MNATAARPTQRYRCPCRHVFQVFGGGRHLRVYKLDDLHWRRPVIAAAVSRVQAGCQLLAVS
jgi:hypothetical protein